MLRFVEVVTVSQSTSFETGGETSRELAKRSGIETSKGAKRPFGERPGGELAMYIAKRLAVQLPSANY